MRSRVKWFNNEKGYGFIEYNADEDIFVHYSAILKRGFKTLKENQLVDFTLIETDKGLQAQDEKKLKWLRLASHFHLQENILFATI